ncbi:MAG: glycosyltransferase family 1 protein [Vicinamibacterales bacterium]
MLVGVDATCWANGRGYGRFIRELLPAMAAEAPDWRFRCFVDAAAKARFDLTAPNVETIEVAQAVSPTQAAAADGNRSPVDMLRLTRAVAAHPSDVFFSPSVYTYFPLPPGIRSVVTIHDAIAERFPALTLPSAKARLFWKAKVQLAVWQATTILTVSDFAAAEIAEVIGVPRTRLRVAVEAPSPHYRRVEDATAVAAVAARLGLPAGARWITYVGGFSPHKNVHLLAEAHGRLFQRLGGACPWLVLVGALAGDPFHGAQGQIREAIARAGSASRVLWPGFVSDEDLRHLHSGAIALALPSMNEGFGLPAVEAAICGCPVVATTASPLPGLLEGGGFFVAPGDLDGLTRALETLTMNAPAQAAMAATALERAAALSWRRCARAALDALAEAAR